MYRDIKKKVVRKASPQLCKKQPARTNTLAVSNLMFPTFVSAVMFTLKHLQGLFFALSLLL